MQSRARNRSIRGIVFVLFEYGFAGGGSPANKSTWARSAFRLKVYGSGAHKEAGRWDSRVSPWNFSHARDLLATCSRLHSSASRDIQARRCLLSSQRMLDTVARWKRKIWRGARETTMWNSKEEEEGMEEMLTVELREASLRSLGPDVYATR